MGSDTSAIGLCGTVRARTAVFITLPVICAAFTTVAGALRVASSFTHAWQIEYSMVARARSPNTGRMCVRRYDSSRTRVVASRLTMAGR